MILKKEDNLPQIGVRPVNKRQVFRSTPIDTRKNAKVVQIDSGENLRAGGVRAKPQVKRQIVETVKKSPILGEPTVKRQVVTTKTTVKNAKKPKEPILKIPVKKNFPLGNTGIVGYNDPLAKVQPGKGVIKEIKEKLVSPNKQDQKEAKELMASTGIELFKPMNKKFLIVIIVMVVLTVIINKYK